jgi:hypothetical protein
MGSAMTLRPESPPRGTSRITSILGGCVLMEEWTGARQSRGKVWTTSKDDGET